jgi:hypothetical protein
VTIAKSSTDKSSADNQDPLREKTENLEKIKEGR